MPLNTRRSFVSLKSDPSQYYHVNATSSTILRRNDDGAVVWENNKRCSKIESGDRDEIYKEMSLALDAAKQEKDFYKRDNRSEISRRQTTRGTMVLSSMVPVPVINNKIYNDDYVLDVVRQGREFYSKYS